MANRRQLMFNNEKMQRLLPIFAQPKKLPSEKDFSLIRKFLQRSHGTLIKDRVLINKRL